MTKKGLSKRPEPTSLGAMFVHKKSRHLPVFLYLLPMTNNNCMFCITRLDFML